MASVSQNMNGGGSVSGRDGGRRRDEEQGMLEGGMGSATVAMEEFEEEMQRTP